MRENKVIQSNFLLHIVKNDFEINIYNIRIYNKSNTDFFIDYK